MAYNERIKNFGRIREYMREFYVFGFKSREEFSRKSARSYDDEKRRIESWLGDYMRFTQTAEGKTVFLSIDSRAALHNPLYKSWKSRSFTDGDITLHFILFDILSSPDTQLTITEIMDTICTDYLTLFEQPMSLDESTLRKKLKEYVDEGLLVTGRSGKQITYRRAGDTDLSKHTNLLDFFSEMAPCGVIGSFLLDKGRHEDEIFTFKHHYITQALDSEVLCDLFISMREKREIEIDNRSRTGHESRILVVPLRIFISAQTGRQYLLCLDRRQKKMRVCRVDYLENVLPGEPCPDFDALREKLEHMREHMWGVMTRKDAAKTERVSFDIHVEAEEGYIINRLEREKRSGTVERVDAHTYRFTADVYDATELVPWIRTFLCRIEKIHFSDRRLEAQFRSDLNAMVDMYGVKPSSNEPMVSADTQEEIDRDTSTREFAEDGGEDL